MPKPRLVLARSPSPLRGASLAPSAARETLARRAETRLGPADRLGALRVRLGIGRGSYRVGPGLYFVGAPNPASPLLVTANYKLSFDALRKELGGLDAWILVLDTRGVNVWCAAGKGSFGTEELLSKLAEWRIAERLSHRRLILPQLGAPGVSAPEIRRRSGFQVVWGPVRAADLPAFLAAGLVKSPEMARVRFGLPERLVLAPLELVQAWPLLAASILLALLSALPLDAAALERGGRVLGGLVGAILAGSLAFPALLPLLPFRAFALKGAVLGLAWALLYLPLSGLALLPALGLGLLSVALVSWRGLNFTGSTTFTSPTGALREVEAALVPTLVAAAAGILLVLLVLVPGLPGGLA